MKATKIITVVLLMLIAFDVFAQNETKLSLSEACNIAVKKNVNVMNAVLEEEKTHFMTNEAKSKLLPQLDGYSSFNYYYSIPKMVLPGEIFGQTGMIAVQIGTKYDWSNGFRASQVLYNQSYFTSLKLSQRLENISTLTLQQKKEEIVYQVSQVYYLCLATEKQIAQLNLTMLNTVKLLEVAKLQQENGIILKSDYSRLMVTKTNLQTQIDNLNQLFQQQLGMLKYLIGLTQNEKVELSDSLSFQPTETSLTAPDFKNRTELQMLDKQMEMTALTKTMNKQAYLPTVSGFGQFYFQGQRDQFDFLKGGNDKFFKVGFVGLSLNVPIFDGFEKHSKIRQADIALEQLANTQKNTTEFFSKEFADAIMQYYNNLSIVTRQQENIKTAEESYSVSLQGYRQQVVTLSDLLMSENALTEARLSYYNALLQLNNAGLDVKKAKGELLNY
jgi:outer membrane protein TolC